MVKIRASGLCGTDLHRYRGSEPVDMITGHEPCGVIEELGPGAPPELAIGDRVMCHHSRAAAVLSSSRTAPYWEESVLVDYGGIAPMKIWLNSA